MRAAALTLLLCLAACAPKAEPIMDGLVSRPEGAERYQEMSRTTGQPVALHPRIRHDESWVLPNDRVQAFVDDLDGALWKAGLTASRTDADDTMRITSYWSQDGTETASVVTRVVSFDKMAVNYTRYWPKGSPQNP